MIATIQCTQRTLDNGLGTDLRDKYSGVYDYEECWVPNYLDVLIMKSYSFFTCTAYNL